MSEPIQRHEGVKQYQKMARQYANEYCTDNVAKGWVNSLCDMLDDLMHQLDEDDKTINRLMNRKIDY